MNTVLDVLFLRNPRIEYVCPPICETIFSGSGSAVIVLEPIGGLNSPTGLILEGFGRSFLTWNVYPGQLCYTVYYQANPGDPFAAVSECVPPNVVALCNPGYYKISAHTGTGDSALSDPFHVIGGGYSYMPTPQLPDTICFNVYRSETLGGTYSLVLACAIGNIFQTCADGCYSVSAITLDGETPLSESACTGTCRRLPCPDGFGFNGVFCECIPCDQPDAPCYTGFHWDVAQCKCIAGGGGGGTIPLTGCTGSAFGETVLAPDGFQAPCTFTESGPLPAGVSFSQDSDLSASISGTPTETGTFNFTVHIVDPLDQEALFSYQLVVSSCSNCADAPWEIDPGPFRLRIKGYVDGLVPTCGGVNPPLPDSQVWDGTFPLLSTGPTELDADNSVHLSMDGKNLFAAEVINVGVSQWVLIITASQFGPVVAWRGVLNTDSPVGIFTNDNFGCDALPATLELECYLPSPCSYFEGIVWNSPKDDFFTPSGPNSFTFSESFPDSHSIEWDATCTMAAIGQVFLVANSDTNTPITIPATGTKNCAVNINIKSSSGETAYQVIVADPTFAHIYLDTGVVTDAPAGVQNIPFTIPPGVTSIVVSQNLQCGQSSPPLSGAMDIVVSYGV